MATRRRFNPRPEFAPDKRLVAAEFLQKLLSGEVRAERVVITANGKTIDLDFDERPPRGQPVDVPRGGGRG